MNIREVRHQMSWIIDADRSDYKPSKIYDWFMCAIIILSIVPLMFTYCNNLLDFISWFTVAIFFVDFILRCFISPIDKYKLGKPWWRRYPFSFMGIIDIMSILPVVYLINPKFQTFNFFRLARLVSFVKISRYSYADDMILRVFKRNFAVLKHLSIFIGIYIILSALLIYNVEPMNNPVTGQKTFSSFFDAIYWAIVTLTTVGYGDIYPVTFVGKVISASLMIGGVGLITTISSIITSGLIKEINHKSKK